MYTRYLTDEELKEIEARIAAATPGPWLSAIEIGGEAQAGTVVDHEGCGVWPFKREADMIFAYKARTDLPRAIAMIRALQQQLITKEHMG